MVRVYTADSTIPDCAIVNGQPMDQLVLDGKTFTVNCKGSRFGASPRMQSPHCLVLAVASPEQEDREGDNMPSDEGAADGDVDMQSPNKTAVELARTAAPATDYKPLASEHLWRTVGTAKRLNAHLRELPATKVTWKTENRFDALDAMELVTDVYAWSSASTEPPNAQLYQAMLTKRPPVVERLKPCSAYSMCTHDGQSNKCKISRAVMTVQDIDKAIAEMTAMDAAEMQQRVNKEVLDVGGADEQFHLNPDYDVIETTQSKLPVASASTLLSYIRQQDVALEEILSMHLFARSLAVRDVTSGATYGDNLRAILPAQTELTREPVKAWMQCLANAPQELKNLVRVTRALALFELLFRTMAPHSARNDQLLMILTGVQVHWVPTLKDGFLHPATLIAIAATEVGRDVIDVGLQNDDTNADLRFLRDCLDDEEKLEQWLKSDLALEAIVEDGRLGARVVSELAQY